MAGSIGSKYFDIFLNYEFWLETKAKQEILGKELLEILKDIDLKGSISASAENNKISYRKVWGDIKKAEEILGFSIVSKKRGGSSGGLTVLTDDGKKMIAAFNELEQEFDKIIYNIAKKFFHELNEKNKQNLNPEHDNI